MPLINCPVCQKAVSSNASTCPNCGERIKKGKCRSLKGGIVFLVLGVLSMLLLSAYANQETNFKYLLAFFAVISFTATVVCFTSPMQS